MTLMFIDIETHIVEIEMSLEYYYINKIITEDDYDLVQQAIRNLRNCITCLERD